MDNFSKYLRVLRNTFGYDNFRPLQPEIISAIAEGKDTVAILPTSAGKSVCFQIPCLVRNGLGIIITPLISLMHDQVKNARKVGIVATLLTGEQTADEKHRIYLALRAGKIKLLYVSPERLAVDRFKELILSIPIAAIVVDEAHCIVEYGGEFRPEYLSIADNLKGIKAPMAAFTATATKLAQDQIIKSLRLKNPVVVRASANRPNLFYQVVPKQENETRQIAEYIDDKCGGHGIIYRTTRQDVERTIWQLSDSGLKCLPYHAGLSPNIRRDNQVAFMEGVCQVMVATIAFGMGVDKSNVRFVLHADLPRSLEGYCQESGRAGRDGDGSVCTLLYSVRDIAKTRKIIELTADKTVRAAYMKQFETMILYAQSKVCRKKSLLKYFNETLSHSCGSCDICGCGMEYIRSFITHSKVA